jgi:hypothetical protein
MYKTPRGLLIAADAVSWLATRSGGPGGQHANTSDTAVTITIDVERAGFSGTVRDRIVAAIPQSSHGLGGALGTARRGRQASATGASSDPPVGFCRAQAACLQTTRRRAQVGKAATVS